MENLIDEQQLLLRLNEGNVEAFKLIYYRYAKELYQAAYRRLKNHDQAQDVIQDVFMKLWQKKQELSIKNLPVYLHVCVRNAVLNLFEKEKRYVPIEELLYNNLNRYGDQADALALRNELLGAYNQLIDSLPPRQKLIFKLNYYKGASTKEIAEKLNISRKTVQNQLTNAVTHLRSSLSHIFFLIIFLVHNL